jgi:hypothetical protein
MYYLINEQQGFIRYKFIPDKTRAASLLNDLKTHYGDELLGSMVLPENSNAATNVITAYNCTLHFSK